MGGVRIYFLEEVMFSLRFDGELGLYWELCILGKGSVYKVYVCFMLILFVVVR